MTPRERNLADIGLLALRHGTTRHKVLRKFNRCPKAMAARREAAHMLSAKGFSTPNIGKILGGRHHTTILYLLGRVKNDRPTINNSAAGPGNLAGA